jgi:hypothetical protein
MPDNRLLRLAHKSSKSETYILSFLQDIGVISDNCYKLDHVANHRSAHKCIMKKWEEFTKWMN